MNYDASTADALILKLIVAIGSASVVIFGIWLRFYKTRSGVSIEKGDRQRFEDAIDDAREARREVHEVNNRMMSVQRDLGRLESENTECNKRADRADKEIAELRLENGHQARQIAALMRNRAGPLSDTEIGVRNDD